jgi:hypothetical protein
MTVAASRFNALDNFIQKFFCARGLFSAKNARYQLEGKWTSATAGGWHASCQRKKWPRNGRANRMATRLIEEARLDDETMNRWMKRRIARSRARCERSSLRQQLSSEHSTKKNLAGAPSREENKETNSTSR